MKIIVLIMALGLLLTIQSKDPYMYLDDDNHRRLKRSGGSSSSSRSGSSSRSYYSSSSSRSYSSSSSSSSKSTYYGSSSSVTLSSKYKVSYSSYNTYLSNGRTYSAFYVYYLPVGLYFATGYYSPRYRVIYYDGYGYNFYYGAYGYYEDSPNPYPAMSTGAIVAIVVILVCCCCCVCGYFCAKLSKNASDTNNKVEVSQSEQLDFIADAEEVTHTTVVIEEKTEVV